MDNINANKTNAMLKLIKAENFLGCYFEVYEDAKGNKLMVEDGVISCLNDYILEENGEIKKLFEKL